MKELLNYPNVVGYGLGHKKVGGKITDELCTSVLVSKKVPKIALRSEDTIPTKIKTPLFPMTDVVEVGVIRAHQNRMGRWRPAPPGVSVGHFQITAGTFGCVVRKNGQRFILSNNHVLANENNGIKGDRIFQPGAYDGGDEAIAELEDFIPIVFGAGGTPTCPWATGVADILNVIPEVLGSSHRLLAYRQIQQTENLVDAAIARPLQDNMIDEEILEIGFITGPAEVKLGDEVKKSGRTTALSFGTIMTIDATVQVQYSNAVATFEDQIISTPMSQPGDSGSLLVGEGNKAVGLLYAGSDQVTIFNRIANVLELLEVTL